MRAIRIILCLFIIGLFYGCGTGGGQQASDQQPHKRLAKVLENDLLVSHKTGDPLTPLADDQTQPAVAYDTVKNQYLVVWTDYTNQLTTGTDIYGAICQGTGTGTWSSINTTGTKMTCGDRFAISTAAGNQAQPKVAFYNDPTPANSKYLVVWTDTRSGSNSQIFGQFVTSTGALPGALTGAVSGPNFPISTVTPGVDINQSDPDVIYDKVKNTFVVAWLDVSIDDTSANIAASSFSPPPVPGVWSPGDTITVTSTSNIRGINVSFSDGGDVTNATVAVDGPNVTVTINAGSNALGLTTPIIVTYGNVIRVQGALCKNYALLNYFPLPKSADNYLVRTIEVSTAGVLSNKKEASGLLVTDPFHELATGNTFIGSWVVQFNESKPKLAYSSVDGDYFVSWSGMNHTEDVAIGPYTVSPLQSSFSVFSGTGSKLNPAPPPTNLPIWVAGNPATVIAPSTIIGWTVSINGLALTEGTDYVVSPLTGRDNNIFTLTVAGTTITSDANNTFPLVITFTYSKPDSCGYPAAVFTDTSLDASSKIKVRKGTGLGLFQDFSFGTHAVAPTLAVDPNTNRLLVAWEEQSGVDKDILGQLVDLDNFLNYGSGISISTATGDQSSPVASFDNVNQRFLVVFEDARNGSANIPNMDIFGQFVDPQGNLSGGNTVVTVTPGNQLAPAVAFGDVDFRKFFVVWKDGSNPGTSDIYGQLLEFSQAPQLLITDANRNPIFSGSIDFGNVNVGSSSDKPFKMCNDGNTQLTINSMTSPDAPFSFTTPSPVTISPGTCYDMNAHFEPTAAGSFAGNPTNNFKTTIDSNGGKFTLYFSGSGVGIQPLTVTTSSLPDGSTTSPYTATLIGFGGVFPYTWSISSGSLPGGITLNTATGVLSGTPVAGTFNFTVKVKDNAGTEATRDLSIKVSVLNITTTGLKPWTQGVEYSSSTPEIFAATGGTPPYTWITTAGSLPNGITLASNGALSGIPTLSGVFSFTVQATDNSTPVHQSMKKDFSITINPAPAILTASLPSGVAGTAYSQTISMTGGTSPNTWSITSGSLPAGLTFDTSTGTISGIPAAPAVSRFTVSVTDASGASSSKDLSISISGEVNISTISLPDTFIGSAFDQTLTATGGNQPYTWSVSAGTLPPGLALNGVTGNLAGSPTAKGTYTFIIKVADANGRAATQLFSVIVATTTSVIVEASEGTVPQDKITVIPSNQLPAPLPADFNVTKAVKFEVDGVTGGSVDVGLTFNSLPATPVFYKLKADNTYVLLQNCGDPGVGTTNCIVSLDKPNKKVVVRIEDNGPFDSNAALGIVVDPIIVGSSGTAGSGGSVSSGGGSGGCSIGGRQNMPTAFADTAVMMTPLFVVMILRSLRRRKK